MTEDNSSRYLATYLAAKARHAEAEWMMRRAEAWFDELAGRFGDDERAYDLAGVALAEELVLLAHRDMLCARDKVKASLGGMSIAQRLAVTGHILCADLPRPVNDR